LVGWGEHLERSIEALNGVSFVGEFGSPGADILLQQGNLIVGSLELPLSQMEVGPQLLFNLVYGFKDIDDFTQIGGKAVGVGVEGECSPGLECCGRACRYGSRVLGVHDGRASWIGTIQRSLTWQAREIQGLRRAEA